MEKIVQINGRNLDLRAEVGIREIRLGQPVEHRAATAHRVLDRFQRRAAVQAIVPRGVVGGQGCLQRPIVADPAGQLDGHVELAHHRGQQLGVGPAAEGGVEIDENLARLGAFAGA
mgnify:CR=1 FL=1